MTRARAALDRASSRAKAIRADGGRCMAPPGPQVWASFRSQFTAHGDVTTPPFWCGVRRCFAPPLSFLLWLAPRPSGRNRPNKSGGAKGTAAVQTKPHLPQEVLHQTPQKETALDSRVEGNDRSEYTCTQ